MKRLMHSSAIRPLHLGYLVTIHKYYVTYKMHLVLSLIAKGKMFPREY